MKNIMEEKTIDLELTRKYIYKIEKENRRLKAKIKLAIVYLENHTYDTGVSCGYTPEWDVRELYELLKGSDNNV